MQIFSARAWIDGQWARNVTLQVGADGHIADIATHARADDAAVCVDTLLPALANVHSHSFQRAMAGMTERRADGQDSFWTWRKLMYRFLDHLTPEHYEAIAAQVFLEMLEAGYASVGEFHYVHHQAGGQHYDNHAELSDRVFSAACATGIGLTHLPVLYTYGGAQKQQLSGGQNRFGHRVDQYATLMETLQKTLRSEAQSDTILGIAPHSLRATAPDELRAIVDAFGDGPIHIHIAEQPKEVDDISNWLSARPVEWLLSNQGVNQRWCLIHATHMTPDETTNLAKSGAVAGLCPITEANLGDGPFNGKHYFTQGGRFGVGSDSNVRISVSEELRSLEYAQRLRDLSRNVMAPSNGSVGEAVYTGAAAGGAQAIGRNAGHIRVGSLADLTAIDTNHTYLCGVSEEDIFDGFCFAADDRVVTDVWAAGRHVVKDGRHVHRAEITKKFTHTMRSLRSVL